MAESEATDINLNFTFPMPDMDILNALDNEALEQIILDSDDSFYYDEVYIDPSLTGDFHSPQVTSVMESNCTEIVWNVTLVPRSLRKNPTYVMVRI